MSKRTVGGGDVVVEQIREVEVAKPRKLDWLFSADGRETLGRAVMLKQAMSGTLGRSSPEECGQTLLSIVEAWYTHAVKVLESLRSMSGKPTKMGARTSRTLRLAIWLAGWIDSTYSVRRPLRNDPR